MDGGELNVKPVKEAEKPKEELGGEPQGSSAADATGMYEDYLGGNAFAGETLNKIKSFQTVKGEAVIYGVYDNGDKGIFTRLNDFMIDHSKITLKDKSYFFNMLAMMVGAGVPVVQSLKSLSGHAQNQRFARVLNTVAYYCESGLPLADAMSRFDNIFDETEMGIVKAGEASGRLNQMLFKLSAQLDRSNDLSMKLWSASIYPIAVLSVLVVVAIGMLVWIFPTLLSLLKEGGIGGGSLPMPTRVLIVIQGALVGYWWLILISLLIIYGVISMYFSTRQGMITKDYLKLKIPYVGMLLRKVYVLNFVAMLGLLIDSGLPVIRALAITGNSITNNVYKIKTQEMIEKVKRGGKISESMMDSEFLFPAEVTEMLRVGETSANLAQVSERVSEQYQHEVDNSLKKMTSVLEPALILFVGVFVALLALAIMAPIFNLSSVVGK